jgi:hypothetical protein
MAMLALLTSVLLTIPGTAGAAPAADVEGNTYTSPNFGYSLTWDDAWFVVSEDSDEIDTLELTNGVTYVNMIGGDDFAGNPELALAAIFGSFRSDESIESIEALPDTAVSEDDRAASAYNVTVTLEDGSTSNVIVYVDARVIVEGESVVLFQSYTPANLFADEWPLIDNLLEGLVIPGATPVDPDDPTPPDDPDEPTNQEESGAGEPGPVFVSGQWRVAVRSAVLNDELAGVGLDELSGDEWLVLIADVTNWSAEDGEFDASEFSVLTEDDDEPVETDAESTAAVASELGVAPADDSMQVEIGAGETERVVLVYVVPDRSVGIALQRDDDVLPVSDALSNTLDPEDLPEPSAPAELQNGEIESSSDGRTISVLLEGEEDSTEIGLIGVAPPTEDDCLVDESEKVLDSLAGSEVLVEADADVESDSGEDRYVWLVNEDGTRTLLNQQVIADGIATVDSLPVEARFGAWMQETENRANDAEIGIWGNCEPVVADDADDADADSTPADSEDEDAGGGRYTDPDSETTPEADDDDDSEAPPVPTRSVPRPNPDSNSDEPSPTATPDE